MGKGSKSTIFPGNGLLLLQNNGADYYRQLYDVDCRPIPTFAGWDIKSRKCKVSCRKVDGLPGVCIEQDNFIYTKLCRAVTIRSETVSFRSKKARSFDSRYLFIVYSFILCKHLFLYSLLTPHLCCDFFIHSINVFKPDPIHSVFESIPQLRHTLIKRLAP